LGEILLLFEESLFKLYLVSIWSAIFGGLILKNIVNLLVVDDDIDFLEALQMILTQQDYTIQCVDSVSKALEALEIFEVDAILSDFTLPEANGLDLLKSIRKTGLSIPFILLSGNLTQNMVHKALQLGAFEVLEKPAQLERLYEVVLKAVSSGIQNRSLLDRLRRHLSTQDYELVHNNIKSESKIRATL
jgi:DNA-binding NtrC family response regulator